MSRRGWAITILVLFAFGVGMYHLTTYQNDQAAIRKKARTERCISLCVNRTGMSHWTTIKVGFGAFQRLCVCWDATEIRLP